MLKPITDELSKDADLLLKRCSDERLRDMSKERDGWNDRMPKIVTEVTNGVYKSIASAGGIRDYAEGQDTLTTLCRRLVIAMRQKASMVDSSDPAVTAFSNKVRAMCHEMLRKKGHFEE